MQSWKLLCGGLEIKQYALFGFSEGQGLEESAVYGDS